MINSTISRQPPMTMQFPPFQIEEADYRAGIISVMARAPSGRTIPLSISKDGSGQFTTNFVPDEIGDWRISITSSGRQIQGSPFTVRVYDGTKVKVFGIEGGENGQPVSFTVDTASAGNGKLKVEVTRDGKNYFPNISQSGKQYKVTFNPDGPGVYSIRVFYATVEVPGSPFKVTIVDSSNVTASGDGIRSCLVGKATSFIVNTGRAVMSNGQVKINITAPSGVPTLSYARPMGAGSYNVSYVPEEVGKYAIQIEYGGKPIPGSPFIVDVFGLNDVTVTDLTKQVVVNQVAILEFDAKNSGWAEPVVKVNGGKVPCEVKKVEGRKYHATFTPRKTGHHHVEVKLYDENIPGSPFKVKVHDGSKIATSLDGARGYIRSPLKFEVNTSPYKGEVKVQIYSPTRKVTPCKVIKMDHHVYNCEFTPNEIGRYEVSITFEDQQIEGSPFLVPVSNPGGVIVSMKSRSLVLGQAFHLTADTTKAGPGDLSIRASNAYGPQPLEGNLIGPGLYAVSFVPEVAGQYFIKISFDCRPLPESPIVLTVYDVRNVVLSAGNSPLSPVGKSRTIYVSTEKAGNAELQAKLTSPGHQATPLQITGSNITGYEISFIPRDPGPHRIDVTYGGVVVPHSPVMFMAFDSSKIKVMGISDGMVNKKSSFLIDLNDSGEGELEVVVLSSNGKPILNEVNALQPGKLEVSCLPVEGGTHLVEITFNKETVQGSPFSFKVFDPNRIQVKGDGIESVHVNTPALFYISANDAKPSDFEIHIRGPPKSRQVSPTITESGNNKVKVEYMTRNVGEYEINIHYFGVPIPSSPFYVKSWDASKVVLSRVGQSQVGVESHFNVEMKDAGDGTVEISILDPTGQLIPNHVSSKCPGILQVSYVPQVAGCHNIMVEFNDVKIKGVPMQFHVVDSSKAVVKGEAFSLVPCHSSTNFTISAPDALMKDVDVKIIGPLQEDVCYNINERSGSFRIDYIPKLAGNYVIEVFLYKTLVKGCPFISKAFDVTKVLITNVCMGHVGEGSNFKVLVAEAGEGVCEINITDPNGQLVPNQVSTVEPGVLDVLYVPTVFGPHRGIVLFNKLNVAGSPFNFIVIDKSKVVCKSTNSGFVPVKSLASVLLYAPMADLKDIEVKIIGPGEIEIMSETYDAGSNNFRVDFTPQIAGNYHVAVKYFGMPIHVCTVKAFDICKVLVGTIGVARLSEENVFNVDVKDAGEGKLVISIQNPLNQMIENAVKPITQTPGLYQVSCIPVSIGMHKVHVRFNELDIHGSPFQMNVCDPKQATVSGEGLGVIRCHRPTVFEINGPGALLPDVHVSIKSPTRRELKVKIKDKGCGKFIVEYTPEEAGEHLISIKYFDEPIQNSPFIATVWNPGFITVDGIKPGIIGRPNIFHVNAGEAGPGNLEVVITSNGEVVKNTARAIPNTGIVEVSYTPTKLEQHLINVRFNGEPIAGSPFVSFVLNGNLARATGPGLGRVKAGVPAKFNVIANAVGFEADLEVFITSPSGQYVPSVISGSYTTGYLVEYIPIETGQHILSVKYADMDIKDSPFHPDVYDETRVLVSGLPIGCIHKHFAFKVDCSSAGCGKLTSFIQGIKTRPLPDISTDDNNVSVVSFIPTEGGCHKVALKFNDIEIPGSPFDCHVVDHKMIKVKWESVGPKPVGKPIQLQIDTQSSPELPIIANVLDPSGNSVFILEDRIGTLYTLQFVPEIVGSYNVNVMYGNEVVPGSPFTCSTYDTNFVRISDVTPNGTIGQEISFLVDTSDAGPGTLDVNVMCKNNIIPIRKDKYLEKNRFIFLAKLPYDYLIDVHFNKEQVPGTPFMYKITNPAINMNLISGNENKPVAVGQLVWAVVTPPPEVNIYASDIEAVVVGPYDDKIIPSRLSNVSNGNVKIEYTSTICGPHAINAAYGGQQITGSPVINNIFDPNLISIEGVKYGEVGKPMIIDIVKNSCGEADLNVNVMGPNNESFPFNLEPEDFGDRVTYVPNKPGIYKINVTYGGLNVPGCPVRQEIKAYYPATASGDGLYKGCVGKMASFYVDTKKQKGELLVQIQAPNGLVECKITPETNGNFRVDYTPTEAGVYGINMTFKKMEVPGPFRPKIIDPAQVRVIDNWECWPQEDHVIVMMNQLKTIGFNTESAGPGDLTATIETPDGNGTLSHDLLSTEGGYLLKFIPKSPGNYIIRVYYNKYPIRIFPIVAICNREIIDIVVDVPPEPNTCSQEECTCSKCTCETENVQKCCAEKLTKSKPRKCSPYPSPMTSEDEENDFVSVKNVSKVEGAPPNKMVTFDGNPELIESNTELVNTPLNPYLVPIITNEQLIGQPFLTQQFYDPNQQFFIQSQPTMMNSFINVDPNIISQQIQPIVLEDTVQEIQDEPPYPYEVNASKHRGHVFEGPQQSQPVYLLPVDPPKETTSSSMQTVPEQSTGGTQTDPVEIPIENQIFLLPYGTPYADDILQVPQPPPLPQPVVEVQTVKEPENPVVLLQEINPEPVPQPQVVELQPIQQPEGQFVFVPYNTQPAPPQPQQIYELQPIQQPDGQFVLYNTQPVPPQPQQVVELQPVQQPENQVVLLQPVEPPQPPPPPPQQNIQLEAFKMKHEEFNNYTSTQVLEPPEVYHHIIVEQPSDPPKPPDNKDMLELAKLLNEMNRPREPPPPAPPVIDENKVILSGPGLSCVRCREQVCFVIDGRDAGPGIPSARLTGLKEDILVDIELVDTNLYGCSYTPTVPGAYLLTIFWSDRQVPGSPIKVTVLPCCDPALVSLHADSLKTAQIGTEASVVADCRRAGFGNLTAFVQGPSKLYQCDVDNRNDGTYEIIFKPVEIGSYTLNVMYDGEHVPESPYSFKVAASPDASKVKVSGEGLKNGILATFDSNIVVDTRGAGPGQLNVKVRGKKGTFQVEMKRDPNRDRVILCKYNPTEVGEYWLNVLWSGEHAPGSPFKVLIVDTLQELKALKSGTNQISGNLFYGTMNSEPGGNINFGCEDF